MRRRHVSAIALSFVAFALSGCGKNENYREAHYQATQSGFTIELKGKRLGMAHDPITALMRQSYESKLVIDVPRIQGVIRGNEIPVKPGWFKYFGQIDIVGESMRVDLYYEDTDHNQKRSVDWNGNYILMRTDATHNPLVQPTGQKRPAAD